MFFPVTGGSASPTGSTKAFLPLSPSSSSASSSPSSATCAVPAHPFSALSRQDAATLDALALPLYTKTPGRAFSPPLADRRVPSLCPLVDLPLLSALQLKKPFHGRDHHLLPGPVVSQRPTLLPCLAETAAPYCLYRYTIPLGPQLAALPQPAKLLEDTRDSLLCQPPWHLTTNHCL